MVQQAGKTCNIPPLHEFFHIRPEESRRNETVKKSQLHDKRRHQVKKAFLPESMRDKFHLMLLWQKRVIWIACCSSGDRIYRYEMSKYPDEVQYHLLTRSRNKILCFRIDCSANIPNRDFLSQRSKETRKIITDTVLPEDTRQRMHHYDKDHCFLIGS